MFMILDEDLIAIRRAHMAGGRDCALMELQRRYLGLTALTAPDVLDRLMAMPVVPPAPYMARGVRRKGPKG